MSFNNTANFYHFLIYNILQYDILSSYGRSLNKAPYEK